MLTGSLPNYRVYACADGKHVAMAALEPKFFFNFCAAVNLPRSHAHAICARKGGAALYIELSALFRTRTRDEWGSLSGHKDCCVSAIYTPEEALDHAQVRARELVESDAGKPAFHLPIRFSGASCSAGGNNQNTGSPGLGAYTQEILRAAGVSEEQLATLSAARAI